MNVNFRSCNIGYFEQTTGQSIYSVIGWTTELAIKFLRVATGVFEEDRYTEVADYLDVIKKEHGGIKGTVNWLIDICEEEGFFTYLTGAEVKKILEENEKQLRNQALLSEEEKKAQMKAQVKEMIAEGLMELKNSGTKNGN